MEEAKSRIDTAEAQFKVTRIETVKAGVSFVGWYVHWAMFINDELRGRIVEGEWIEADLAAWARMWGKYEHELQRAEAEAREVNERMQERWREGVERARLNGWERPQQPPAAVARAVEKPTPSRSRRDLPSLNGAQLAGAINRVDPTTREVHQMVLVDTTLRSAPRAEIEGLEAWLVGKTGMSGDWTEHARWCRMVGLEGLQFSSTQLNLPGIEDLVAIADDVRQAAVDRLLSRTKIQVQNALRRCLGDPKVAGASLCRQVSEATPKGSDRKVTLAAVAAALLEVADDVNLSHDVRDTARTAMQAVQDLSNSEPDAEQMDIMDLAPGEIAVHAEEDTHEASPPAAQSELRNYQLWAKEAGMPWRVYREAARSIGLAVTSSVPIGIEEHTAIMAALGESQATA